LNPFFLRIKTAEILSQGRVILECDFFLGQDFVCRAVPVDERIGWSSSYVIVERDLTIIRAGGLAMAHLCTLSGKVRPSINLLSVLPLTWRPVFDIAWSAFSNDPTPKIWGVLNGPKEQRFQFSLRRFSDDESQCFFEFMVPSDFVDIRHEIATTRKLLGTLTGEGRSGLIERDLSTGKLAAVSPEVYEIFGVDLTSDTSPASEKLEETFFSRVFPKDFPEMQKKMRLAHERGIASIQEIRIRHHSLGTRVARIAWFPIKDSAGNPTWLIVNVRDVTSKRRLEESLQSSHQRYKLCFSEGALGMVIFDKKNMILETNAAFCHMLDYEPYEMVGRSCLDFTHPDDFDKTLNSVCASLAGGMGKFGQRKRFIRKDGQVVWVRIYARDLNEDESSLAMALIQDISAQVKMEDLKAELVHMSRLVSLSEMVTGLAHELNQPLSAIAMLTEAAIGFLKAKKSHEPVKVGKILEKIQKQSLRAGEIIKRLKQMARNSEPERTSVQMNDLLRDVTDFMAADTRKFQAQIVLELDPKLPEVYADPIQIEQVLVNLMRNGLESMQFEVGERILRIESSQVNDMVQVAISDNGIGIPDENSDRIFETFFSTKLAGSGIGLSISKSILDSHGGRLWFDKNKTKGATFRYSLPITKG
jgi:two-component system sensor kinase FixL